MILILLALRIFVIIFAVLVAWIVLLKLIRHFWKISIPAILTGVIDNPIRRKIQPPKTFADRMRLQSDMLVLEVGPGKGSYTFEVAKRVPNGKVVGMFGIVYYCRRGHKPRTYPNAPMKSEECEAFEPLIM